MILQHENLDAFPVISFDDKRWYKVSDIITEKALITTIDVLNYYQSNPTVFVDTVSDNASKLVKIKIKDYIPQIPFLPLSYRDFMLYEEHYINAKKGFIEKCCF